VGRCTSSVSSSDDVADMGSSMLVFCIFMSHAYAHHDLGLRTGIIIYKTVVTISMARNYKTLLAENNKWTPLPGDIYESQTQNPQVWAGYGPVYFPKDWHFQGHASVAEKENWIIVCQKKIKSHPATRFE
jgi:hypothetical protein